MKNNVLYVGDFIKNNGPSSIDINLSRELNVIRWQSTNKNIFKLLLLIIKASHVHVSGVSFTGAFSVLISRFFFVKTSYKAHGLIKFEKRFRKIHFWRFIFEFFLIHLSDKKVFVSNKLQHQALQLYCLRNESCLTIPNAVSHNHNQKFTMEQSRKGSVVLIGGGRKEKGILSVCHSIQFLIERSVLPSDMAVYVFGEDGEDTDKIKEFQFVQYKGFQDKKILNYHLSLSSLFILNSVFESFSLSIFDALDNGCKVLVTSNVGAIDYIVQANNLYIINSEGNESLEDAIHHAIESTLEPSFYELDSQCSMHNVVSKHKKLLGL